MGTSGDTNMASISRVVTNRCIRPLLSNRGALAAVQARNYAHWNFDWQPDEYPTTPEERRLAAKKYGLREGDYEIYPDDGFGRGDYPKLPIVSFGSRSFHEDWDDPMYRRNYGEPMHIDADAFVGHIMDPNFAAGQRTPEHLQKMVFFGVFTVIFIMAWFGPAKKSPILPRSYPRDLKEGEKHYTFEPAD